MSTLLQKWRSRLPDCQRDLCIVNNDNTTKQPNNMALQATVEALNKKMLAGEILDAVKMYFAENSSTTDFDGTVMTGKDKHITKMEGFLGGIANVNGITLHHAATEGNVSFTEYTFDFDMKDGSKILWHEIIRRVWENDLIVDEQYFKG